MVIMNRVLDPDESISLTVDSPCSLQIIRSHGLQQHAERPQRSMLAALSLLLLYAAATALLARPVATPLVATEWPGALLPRPSSPLRPAACVHQLRMYPRAAPPIARYWGATEPLMHRAAALAASRDAGDTALPVGPEHHRKPATTRTTRSEARAPRDEPDPTGR